MQQPAKGKDFVFFQNYKLFDQPRESGVDFSRIADESRRIPCLIYPNIMDHPWFEMPFDGLVDLEIRYSLDVMVLGSKGPQQTCKFN